MRLRLGGLFLKTIENPLESYATSTSEVLEALKGIFPTCQLNMALAWPSPKRSSGRFYAYVYDEISCRLLTYVKFANREKDVRELESEIVALEKIQALKDLPFSVARVLHKSRIGQLRFAAFELLPLRADRINWNAESWSRDLKHLHDAFAKGTECHIEPEQARQLNWVQDFLKRAETNDREILERSLDAGADVCATHGDMALHNFKRKDGRWWVFDWETYTPTGPELVDELTVFVCSRYFIEKWPLVRVLRALEDQYPLSDPKAVRKVVQASSFIWTYKLSFADELLSIMRHYGERL